MSPAQTGPDRSGGREKKWCEECGEQYPETELVDIQGTLVCASCKPEYVQRIKEGVPKDQMRYGGFFIRFGAIFLDGIILGAVVFPIIFAMGMGGNMEENPGASQAIVNGISAGLYAAYYVFFHGYFGATLGKMAFGLKVVTGENREIGYGKAFLRYLAEILSGLICYIGYIMAAFDDQKRALHDRLCNTRVIRE